MVIKIVILVWIVNHNYAGFPADYTFFLFEVIGKMLWLSFKGILKSYVNFIRVFGEILAENPSNLQTSVCRMAVELEVMIYKSADLIFSPWPIVVTKCFNTPVNHERGNLPKESSCK